MNDPSGTAVTRSPLAGLMHELRTPLAAIIGMADAMGEEILGPLPPPYAHYVRLIREAGLHTLAVLTALTQAEPAADEPAAPAAQVVRDVAEALRAGLQDKRLRLELDVSDADQAMIPKRVLGQIAFNLVGNAIKFTGAGGRITVALRLDAERLRLEVVDTGGLPHSPPPPRGGLGLDIVRALCAAHGGEFRIETTPTGAVARAWLATIGE